MAKRKAKNVSAMGMKISPSAESSVLSFMEENSISSDHRSLSPGRANFKAQIDPEQISLRGDDTAQRMTPR